MDDLDAEYTRVSTLGMGRPSTIFYINVVMRYYCFMVEDPDGNRIEITGRFSGDAYQRFNCRSRPGARSVWNAPSPFRTVV